MTSALALVLFNVIGVVVTPCQAEDTTPNVSACYWDAEVRGNGLGHSFIRFTNGMTFRLPVSI
jgi:hypothetical protein